VPSTPRGPRWRRDRLLIVLGAVAAVAILIGLLGSLLAPPGPGSSGDGDAATPESVTLSEVDDLRDHIGQQVVVDGAEVESVPADEGFWVDAGGDRVWVQVDTAGESPYTVTDGQRVAFSGLVVAHDEDFARRPEFPEGDAEELAEAGAHVEVDVSDLQLG
jgi:uncharacterized protein YdeI (BOF family)